MPRMGKCNRWRRIFKLAEGNSTAYPRPEVLANPRSLSRALSAGAKGEVEPLTLNLIGMWCSLTLQTLPVSTLREYLPVSELSPRTGCHLNFSSPLRQSHQSEVPSGKELGELYKSDDPEVVAYYGERSKQFHGLRHSKVPELKAYWRDAFDRGKDTRMAKLRNKVREEASEGK
jgi:hypothetical protein